MFTKSQKKSSRHSVIQRLIYSSKHIYKVLSKKRTLKDTWTQIQDFLNTIGSDKKPKKWFQKYIFSLCEIILLLGVYILLFSALKMEWFLRDIIPIGGDVPYHFANYIDLKEILLPNWQISGWSDASFGGFQLFQSYPILPFILIYILDLFMGSGVAFKAIMILGAVGLPLATYWTLIQAKVHRPGPIYGSILSLAYLFHDDHYAFGGNLRSVFSGEFAHSLSILFLMIFCGFLFKAFENKKYIPHTTLWLAVIGFTHPISFAVAFFLPLGFLIMGQEKDTPDETVRDTFKQRSAIALRIMFIGGLLFCTWAIGHHTNSDYTINGVLQSVIKGTGGYGGWGNNFYYLIPKLLFPFSVAFLFSIVYTIFLSKKISQAQVLFLWGSCIAYGFFLTKFMGWGVRFLPLLYIFVVLSIAATVGYIAQYRQKLYVFVGLFCIFISSIGYICYFIYSHNLLEQYRGTSGYNFMGAERLQEWNSVKLTSQFLSENFDTQTKNKTGSNPPRVFSFNQGDLFRAISKASMYDGLFGNSSFQWFGKQTFRQIERHEIPVEKIWNYMDLSNTDIIIAPIGHADYLEKTSYFGFLKTLGTYKIFETRNTLDRYVIPLKYRAYSVSDYGAWSGLIGQWYTEYSEKSPFIIYNPDDNNRSFLPYDSRRKDPIPYTTPCNVEEVVQREKIHITTDCIGRPLLVKFAYHQNWQVKGAKKIYRASPSFMVIVPESKEVTMYYGKRPYNYIAYTCGILGIILFFTYGYIENTFSGCMVWAKRRYKNIFQFLNSLSNKLKLQILGNFLLQNSASFLAILVLLLSIAFVYTNKG